MYLSTVEKFGIGASITAMLIAIAGYISNIYWLATHASEITIRAIVSILGIIAPPVGIIHGIVSWFV